MIKRSIFDAVDSIDNQDAYSARKQQKTLASQVATSKAAQAQLQIYHSTLECRILLQKALQTTTTTTTTSDIITPLVEARRKLMVATGIISNTNNNDDTNNSLDDRVASDFEACAAFWEKVITNRHQSVKLQTGKASKSSNNNNSNSSTFAFSTFDAPLWQQIETTVDHEMNNNNNSTTTNATEFNDTKVYQQLLKDFVTSHVSNTSGGQQQLSLQDSWRKEQKRQKEQRHQTLDRRATKGRKIRYQVIPKLVHFTHPLQKANSNNNDVGLDEDGWFKSLFGGSVAKQK